MSPSVRSPLTLVVLLAVVAVIPAAPAAHAAAKTPAFMRVHITHHPARRPARVRVATRDGVRWIAVPHSLRARLNGHRIEGEFRSGLGTLTAASLGLDTGARYGRNRLVVRAGDGQGHVDREVHHFVIRRTRPLVG